MAQLLTLQSAALPDGAHVVAFRGREAISTLYRFSIGLRIDDPSADLDKLVQQRAYLQINGAQDADPMGIHGIVSAIEHLREHDGRALYRATLVPALFNLTLTRHSRIFVKESVVDIITKLLKANGLSGDDFAFKLKGSYTAREHACQYKESDYAFICRWMEREGLYFFFEQGDEREKLIITDDKVFHQPLRQDKVRYVPGGGGEGMSSEAFEAFVYRHQAIPGSVELNDYDGINPDNELLVRKPTVSGGHGEISLYGEHYVTKPDGERLARVRAEELSAGRKLYSASGRVHQLRPGYLFELDEHPRSAFNGKYLTTELIHQGNQSAGDDATRALLEIDTERPYQVRAVAVPSTVQYRSPRRHGWPRIDGFELAVVCGKANSQYAQIDKHGRYHIRIKFDESDLGDGGASTWVRMLQPHGGTTEGWHFPLRKKTEVLLLFLGGDPDRPVIAGVVPNAQTPSPVTASNHSHNVIQTGSGNRVEMEDDGPYVDISCPTEDTRLHLGKPHDGHGEHVVLHTSQDSRFHYGTSWDIFVGATKFERVKKDVDERYDANHVSLVEGYYSQGVFGFRDRYVKEYEKVVVDKDRQVEVKGDHTLKTPKTTLIQAGSAKIEMRSGYILIDNGAGAHLFLHGNQATLAADGGLKIVSLEGGLDVTTSTRVTLSSGQKVALASKVIELNAHNEVKIDSSGKLDIVATKALKAGGKTVTISGKSSATLEAPSTTVKGKDALSIGDKKIDMKGTAITIKGDSVDINE